MDKKLDQADKFRIVGKSIKNNNKKVNYLTNIKRNSKIKIDSYFTQ